MSFYCRSIGRPETDVLYEGPKVWRSGFPFFKDMMTATFLSLKMWRWLSLYWGDGSDCPFIEDVTVTLLLLRIGDDNTFTEDSEYPFPYNMTGTDPLLKT